jgi:hypothetical protein
VLIRYRVKPDQVSVNEELVRAVYEELAQTQTAGLQYATFKLDDGVSFVHIALIDGTNGPNPLAGVAAFDRFLEGANERCDERPVVSELSEVGSYRLLATSPER